MEPRPGKPHILQQCSTCKVAWATEIAAWQIHLGPVELARSLTPNQLAEYLAFCDEHEKQGHELGVLAATVFERIPTA